MNSPLQAKCWTNSIITLREKLTVWRGEVVRPGGGVGGAGEAGGEGAGGHGRDPVGGQVLPLRVNHIYFTSKIQLFCIRQTGRCWENWTSYSLIQTSRNTTLYYFLHLLFTYVFMYFIRHCLIWCPSDSSLSEDAGIEPETVAMFALSELLWIGCLCPRLSSHLVIAESLHKPFYSTGYYLPPPLGE